MTCWLLDNSTEIISIAVGGFIAYHVYFLSKKLNLKDKLIHKKDIRNQVEPILRKISEGISSKCELVNVKKYLTHYPHENRKNKDGYTYFGGELKALRFEGIEFFSGIKELYKTKEGVLTLLKEGNIKQESNVFEVGVIPYEWIDYIDISGDEFSYRPQFFSHFKGIHKTPYKYVVYYIKNENFDRGSDSMDMQWRRINVF